jgi:hypothetical protein
MITSFTVTGGTVFEMPGAGVQKPHPEPALPEYYPETNQHPQVNEGEQRPDERPHQEAAFRLTQTIMNPLHIWQR